MNEALNVLCLSKDTAASQAVVALLGGLPGFAVTAREVDYGAGVVDLHDVRDPNLVVVILGADPLPGLAMIEEVHRAVPATQVLALAPDEHPEIIVKAMRAGADEFLPLPVDANALLKVCIKVSTLRGSANGTTKGEVWVAYGAKGGVGVTTLVANLGFALRTSGRPTALVDLDPYAGDLALFLNVTPSHSLRDIVSNFKRLDSVFMQGAMIRHSAGLELLASPPPVPGEPPLFVSREQTLRMLEILDASHAVTIVDTTPAPLEATRAAISCADRIFLVTELTLPVLRASVRALDWMREEGVEPESTVELVVSKYANRSWEVAAAEAAKTMRLPVRAFIPRDEAATCSAINGGLPLDQVRGGQPVQRAIASLVSAAPEAEAGSMLKGFRRLFSTAERRV
jgi:pilus assembly protein CpaE